MPSTATSEVKNAGTPDETRPFADKGKAEVVNIGGREVIRGTFEPGWRWSDHVKPIAKTESCQAAHYGYCVQGTMRVRMDGGEEMTVSAGDFATIPPGHDAWIEGDEACVFIDFGEIGDYAKR